MTKKQHSVARSRRLSSGFWQQQWTLKDAVAPWNWFTQSIALKESADVVWCQYLEEMILLHTDMFAMQPRPVSNIYGMLAGLSLEVLLKGMWLSQHPGSVDRASHTIHLGWGHAGEPNGHDLLGLAQIVGRDCSPEEQDVLAKLSACVRWAGRYPMANKPEEEVLVASHTGEEGYDWVPGTIRQPDRTVFEALFDELSAKCRVDADLQIDGFPWGELATVKERLADVKARLRHAHEAASQIND
jgi:hypothetical protein